MELVVALLLIIVAYYLGVRQGIKKQMGIIQQWVVNKHNCYTSEREVLLNSLEAETNKKKQEEIEYKISYKNSVINFLENEVERDFF